MMEKVGATRRSQRAASLTAQVLLNYQIEDENNNNLVVKSVRKQSICKDDFEGNLILPSKRGRKRSVIDAKLSHTVVPTTSSSTFYPKKTKLDTGCSGHMFPVTKPFQVDNQRRYSKKLTASVTPLMKPEPALCKQPPQSSAISSPPSGNSSSPANPILLLPVSLQANRTPGHGDNGTNVGGLSLVTLQASPDLMNCFGLDKPLMNPAEPKNQWGYRSPNNVTNPPLIHRFNTKLGTHSFSSVPADTISCYKSKPQFSDYGEAQSEPLNLKMGETTVPSIKISVTKPIVTPAKPARAPSDLTCCAEKNLSHFSNAVDSKATKKSIVPKSTNSSKTQRRRSRTSPDNASACGSSYLKLGKKRLPRKTPSPDVAGDYACSSPDSDDVQRNPRLLCSRKQINLRHKAAPAPKTLEYEQFVEVQRQLLAKAKRAQRAKTKGKTKTESKKSKPKQSLTTDDESINNSDQFKVQASKQISNGWSWTGKPYMSFVFSLDSGKYVRRKCYPGMVRKDKRYNSTDVVLVRDCIFIMASGEEELSYIGKVTALWEKPSTKEMMISLVWYYRPEHTEGGSDETVSEDELFSSRHQDVISVTCVEERCHVLTYSQFCRVHAKNKRDQQWRKNDARRVVPRDSKSSHRAMLPSETPMSAQDSFFCRYYYDVHPRRIRNKLPSPCALSH